MSALVGSRKAAVGSDDGAHRQMASLAVKYALGAVVGVLALAVLARATESESRRYSPRFVQHVRSLVRAAAQRSSLGAQDDNPLVALMHVNSALAYAQAARRMVPSKEIERIAQVDLDELIFVLEEEQLACMRRINEIAPELQPDGVFAVHTGWLG